jgi:hypothetical protein
MVFILVIGLDGGGGGCSYWRGWVGISKESKDQ